MRRPLFPQSPSGLRLPAALFIVLASASVACADDAPADSLLTLAESEWHLASPDVGRIVLAHPFIVPGSLVAEVDGEPWRAGSDFRVAGPAGIWIPLRPLGPPGGAEVPLRLSYRFHPAALLARRDLHTPASPPSATPDPDGKPAAAPSPPASAASSIGQLDVRGSKTVRMSSGNRRELTVDQTLRLAVSGRLTEDITVQAALSDDNLPVVPEGNTEELRDVDNVRVELTAPQWRAVLGDFVALREGTVFGDYRRKLQGVTVDVGGPGGGGDVLAGSPRGTYRSVQIRGQEANQGPYFLGAGDAGSELFIVAGSERVRLDGEPLTRGADRDYVVDYVRGTVTFTYRRLITADSEIVVEFEQGEGPYGRTVAGASARVAFGLPGGDAPGTATVRLLRESDDPDRPRRGDLGDADRQVLADAGDDPDLAVSAGVTPRAAGEGRYRRVFVGDVETWLYDAVNGDHDVTFFNVGEGLGNYGVDSLTVAGERAYGYRGAGAGSYRVGSRLELPSRHEMAVFAARIGDAERPRLAVEMDASRRDPNVLSDLDDDDDDGAAWRANLDAGRGELRLGGRRLGSVALTAGHEQRDGGFRPFLLRRDRFDYERWGLGQRAARDGFLDERDAQSEVRGEWSAAGGGDARRLVLAGFWNRLRHGDALEADGWNARGEWRLWGFGGRSVWNGARAEDGDDPLDVRRRTQEHLFRVERGIVRPFASWRRRGFVDDAGTGPSARGHRRREWELGLESAPGRSLAWRTAFTRGLADSLYGEDWDRIRDSRTGRLHLGTPAVGGVRLSGDATVRTVVSPGSADQTTRLAKINLSGGWRATGTDWSLIYGVDNSRTEVLDRQIVFVGVRQGDYDQEGRFVGRNLGDFTVLTVGTDSLVATTEATADLNWRQDFGFLGRRSFWGAWSSTTRLTVRSRSRAEEAGPVLRFAPGTIFDPDDTVLGEVGLRQEVDLLKHLRRWDLRLRFDFDQALDRQYATRPERRLRRQHQVLTNTGLGARTNLSARVVRIGERRATEDDYALGASRSYDSIIWQQELEGSFRPIPGNRLALAADYVSREDGVSGIVQKEIGLRPSAQFRIAERWSGTTSLRLASVDSREPSGSLRPYFYPRPGVNHEASARLAWDPSAQLTVSLVYFGRRPGEGGWQHDVRLESTARF